VNQPANKDQPKSAAEESKEVDPSKLSIEGFRSAKEQALLKKEREA